MDWLDSVIGSPSYSTDMELSYDAMVAKSQLRESTGQFKDVFKNGTMIINEDVSVKEAEAALFQKTETPEWNARIFEEMQRTMLGQQPKTASQSVVDMLTESIGKYERYTGSELKAKPMFFFSNIDSVTQDQTDNYTKAIKDI